MEPWKNQGLGFKVQGLGFWRLGLVYGLFRVSGLQDLCKPGAVLGLLVGSSVGKVIL